ncbi:beta-galactosidase [Robertkochia solimangrovi]|nr:beta-galactosidase [Robertkochia solimangrovi]
MINAQSPEITEQRKQLFDHDWKFSPGDHPDARNYDFEDEQWQDIILPHDWSVQFPIEASNPSAGAGGYFKNGMGWYRKEFNVSENLKGKKVSIQFGGVYMNAEVFINGRSLGIHPYGYTPFSYDLTPYLKYGEQNVLSVKVDNSEEINSRWFSGSGIYRHVWITVSNPLHFIHEGIFITTPEVSKAAAVVQMRSKIINESINTENFTLNYTISKGGNLISSGDKKVMLEKGEDETLTFKADVTDPELWSPESPQLYLATISLKKDGSILDEAKVTFGIRSIEYSASKGFLLNDTAVLINGGNVHHDNGALGAAAFDWAEVRKVKILKEAGFNAVRTSHNPPSEAFLAACDSIGLLVIDESFDGWRTQKNPYDYSLYFDHWYKRDIQSMVTRDRNHPSIVFWSIGNEIIERKDPEAVVTARLLKEAILELDTTRPVTSAMTTWDNDWEIFDPLFAVHDVGGYNYQLHHAEADHQRVPERVIMQTESYPKDAFFCWDMTQKHSYIIGDFVWTAMDYLGESGIGRYYYPGEPDGEHWETDLFPWHGAYCGDIDLLGWRKPISHYRSMLWNNDEKLYMAVKEPNPEAGPIKQTMWAVWPTWERWNWNGYEGKPLNVEVYTKYPQVKLYLNNKLIGEKSVSIATEFKAEFEVIYTTGRLVAKAYQEGKEMESFTLETAKKVKKIQLNADRKSFAANGQDLVFVSVAMIDSKGRINPEQEYEINFTIDGPGEIIAVDNGNLRDTDPYAAHSRKTWNGKAMVIVRSGTEAGAIRLQARTEGLKSQEVIINALK